MDWGKTRFFLGEVFRNFTRNAAMQLTAIGTVAVTVVLLGAFLFARAMLSGIGAQVMGQFEIAAYAAPDATVKQIDAAERAMRADPRVLSVTFVSKKDGLAALRSQLRGVVDTSILASNPLPDKIRIKVKDPALVPAVAAEARKLDGVQNVVYAQALVQQMLQVGAVLRAVGIAVIVVFLLVAGIIISNTIRLTVFARRREIAIMQLVGATNTYIRMPFICEGLLDGIIGSALAIAVLALAKGTLWPRMVESLSSVALDWKAANVDGTTLALELLLVGGLVGAIASWISVGRYLRT